MPAPASAGSTGADAPSIGVGRALLGPVETDRFCESCGFNLRGLRVFRDGASKLILVQCSECGTLHPASSLTTNARGAWFRRLASALLVAWMLFILWCTFITGVIEVALQMATIETLRLNRPSSEVWVLARKHAMALGWYFFLSLSLPATAITVFSVAAHHWKKWGYFVIAVALPIAPALVIWQIVRNEFPDSYPRTTNVRMLHTGTQILGGLLGAAFGRPIARLLATLFIPPRTRQALGFLWLADGKTPPRLAGVADKAVTPAANDHHPDAIASTGGQVQTRLRSP
ncbi:MAG TPA: hypothetical protein DEB06_04850 [Phycisphaerales bacterium]|nr:hypothetical protein [Phycisphaerales bacterium]